MNTIAKRAFEICTEECSGSVNLLDLLIEVRNACLFDDDDGRIGVSEEPTITHDLFDRICAAINSGLPAAVGLNQPSEQPVNPPGLRVALRALKGLHRAGQKQGWHQGAYPEEMEMARLVIISIEASGLLVGEA